MVPVRPLGPQLTLDVYPFCLPSRWSGSVAAVYATYPASVVTPMRAAMVSALGLPAWVGGGLAAVLDAPGPGARAPLPHPAVSATRAAARTKTPASWR
jgi:hypothetical protein